jgi:chromate transporter
MNEQIKDQGAPLPACSHASPAHGAERTSGHGVPFGEAMKVWARVAALSFGGPAGQIAVMHRIIVEEKKWIGE